METKTIILGMTIIGEKQTLNKCWLTKYRLKNQQASESPLLTLPCLSFFICKMSAVLPHRMKDEDKYKTFSIN